MSKRLIHLKELSLKSKMAKYPNIPGSYIPPTKYEDKTANGLTKAIVDFIDYSGGWATRISVEGRYIEKLGTRIPSSVKIGTADIHACYKGIHLSIEVKIGSDRQSEAQKEIERDIKAAGGQYFIAKDFDSFHEWFSKLECVCL